MALLIHDELYMVISDIIYLTNIFGVNNIIELIKMKILIPINDSGLWTVMKHVEKDNGKILVEMKTFLALEEEYFNKYVEETTLLKSQKIKQLKYFIYEKSINIDAKKMEDLIIIENECDLKNRRLTDIMNVEIQNESAMINDMKRFNRMIFLNQALLYCAQLGATDSILEAKTREFLDAKISPYLQLQQSGKPEESFLDILEMKKIPNLGLLYTKNIISLIDILKVRENINGKIFRKWYRSIDYDEDEVRDVLLGINKINLKVKAMTWLLPTVIGFNNPMLGSLCSAMDSFILQKLQEGWNPRLFLDNVLKEKLIRQI